jgi:hypothetical protein
MLKSIHNQFVDSTTGRSILLRGINLGGDSKNPTGVTTLDPKSLDPQLEISFVGRPFALHEAKEHLDRLKAWGFNSFRLVIVWEAIQPKSKLTFDQDYLSYLKALFEILKDESFYVFLDLHQDCFSRFTGGDGAPLWLLQDLGIHINNLKDFSHRMPDFILENKLSDYKPMSWSRNYMMPLNGLLWTLFWAGDVLCPDWKIDGYNTKEYIHFHYFNMMDKLLEVSAPYPFVIGLDPLNESSRGWVGKSVDSKPPVPGFFPTPSQSIKILNGESIQVSEKSFSLWHWDIMENKSQSVTTNEKKLRIWDKNSEMKFNLESISELDFQKDCFKPFLEKTRDHLDRYNKDWILFIELDAESVVLDPKITISLPRNSAMAPHYYDLPTMESGIYLKNINIDIVERKLHFGESSVQSIYSKNIKRIIDSAPYPVPILLGEFGIPFDLENRTCINKHQFNPESAWKDPETILNFYYQALDKELISGTLWNYSSTNSSQKSFGDGWNKEDLSIYCKDLASNGRIDGYRGGGRAIRGFARPYPEKWFGENILFHYDPFLYKLRWQWKPDSAGESFLRIPKFLLDSEFEIHSDSQYEWTSLGLKIFHQTEVQNLEIHWLESSVRANLN